MKDRVGEDVTLNLSCTAAFPGTGHQLTASNVDSEGQCACRQVDCNDLTVMVSRAERTVANM